MISHIRFQPGSHWILNLSLMANSSFDAELFVFWVSQVSDFRKVSKKFGSQGASNVQSYFQVLFHEFWNDWSYKCQIRKNDLLQILCFEPEKTESHFCKKWRVKNFRVKNFRVIGLIAVIPTQNFFRVIGLITTYDCGLIATHVSSLRNSCSLMKLKAKLRSETVYLIHRQTASRYQLKKPMQFGSGDAVWGDADWRWLLYLKSGREAEALWWVVGGVYPGEHGEDEGGRLARARLALSDQILRLTAQKHRKRSLLDFRRPVKTHIIYTWLKII